MVNNYTEIEKVIASAIESVIRELYEIEGLDVALQPTKREFEGHYTYVVFPIVKQAKKAPAAVAEEIGAKLLQSHSEIVKGYNVVNGFLNILIQNQLYVTHLTSMASCDSYGFAPVDEGAPLYMVEYSSPNTNKPLHLGHIRNNLLGYSLSLILEANGKNVVKTNIVNDRGVHICKSMLAWKKWGGGVTPKSSGKKGDHLVGDFYVLFDQKYREEINSLIAQGLTKEEAESKSQLMQETREMLQKWEQGDEDVIALWQMMNGWVYEGFDATYKQLGVSFDKIYYESDTYLVGRDEVLRGLREGIFERDPDGSVWADLTNDGYDRKILLRADGTSVYITQDIGTAKLRHSDYPIDQMIYVVGNEQEYHFQVLSVILDKLGFAFGKSLKHFSYGMVELPHGKMKSREGTVVDADDLMAEMINQAYNISAAQGRLGELPEEERHEVARKVGLGALKYFLLKVDPKKNMLFDPEESIDFNGNTGPFIQYTYARIQSVLRKASDIDRSKLAELMLSEKEIAIINRLDEFPGIVRQAGELMSPAVICNYAFELGKEFNQFYHDHSILNEPDDVKQSFRLLLSEMTAKVLASAMGLLGIEMPESM